MRRSTISIAITATIGAAASVCAEVPAPVLPVVHDAVAQLVAAGTVPGSIVFVAEHGRTRHFEALGQARAGAQTAPLRTDTAIWLASMAKPMTATAVLILVEQGKIGLDDPVGKYVPAFMAPQMVRVLRPGSPPPPPPGPPQANPGPPPQYDLVPAQRPITIRDLLTHRSGLPSDPGVMAAPIGDRTLAEWAPTLAAAPLEIQPGSKWVYNNAAAFHLLGRVVEVASGMPFDRFMQQRLFDPLGMKNTGFGPSQFGARAVPIMAMMQHDPAVMGGKFKSGAAGIWATLDDYARFAQMLADDGRYQGHRLLKPETVAMMRTEQAAGMFNQLQGRPPSPGLAFGFAVAVVVDPAAANVAVPAGSFGWAGGGGSRFWVSRQPNRVLVMFAPPPPAQIAIEKAVQAGLDGK